LGSLSMSFSESHNHQFGSSTSAFTYKPSAPETQNRTTALQHILHSAHKLFEQLQICSLSPDDTTHRCLYVDLQIKNLKIVQAEYDHLTCFAHYILY
jgi:hypothetical protein